MKATFPLKALQDACSDVSAIVPSRTTKDVLKNIRIRVTKEICTLYATDSETSIERHLRGVECRQPGEILILADKINAILRESKSDTVTIDCEDRIAKIACGRAKFEIPTEDPSGFPPGRDFVSDKFFSVSSSDMKKLIQRTCPFTGGAHKSFALGGVCLDLSQMFTEAPDSLVGVATDSSRASIVEVKCSKVGDPGKPEGQVLVPVKALKAIQSSLESGGTVDFSIGKNSIAFRAGDTSLASPLVTGRFPTWKKALPQQVDFKADFPAGILASAVRQAAITSSVESCSVTFAFTESALTLTAHGADVGKSSVEVPVSFPGTHSFMLDPAALAEGLKMVDQNAIVTMNIENEGSILFTAEDGMKYVQMPIILEGK